MPKPQWDKKTISTYVTKEQKEIWEKTAKAERKAIADFIRDRVESTINNNNGKVCIWLEVPKELLDKAETDDIELDELIQYHILRTVKEDADKELQWEQSANSPDSETLKAKISELERQIEGLTIENQSLRNRGGISGSTAIFKILDNKKFLTLEQIAVLLNIDSRDEIEMHHLYEEITETMFNEGMIEYKHGRGYRFNPDMKPVERIYPGKEIKLEVL
jgi:hypothetical protein